MRLVPKWLRYFGGQADKIEGSTIPLDRLSIAQLHRSGAPRSGRRDHALELARLPLDDGGRAGARGGQHRRREAVRGDVDVDARSCAAGDRGGSPARRPERRHGAWTDGGGAGRHPDVAKISVTGGIETGRAIGVAAADRLAKVTLELGGKSPTSCSTTRTSTPPRRVCWPGSSPRRDRPASPAHARSSTSRSSTTSSSGSPRAREAFASETRWTRRPKWVRSPRRASSRRSPRSSTGPVSDGARGARRRPARAGRRATRRLLLSSRRSCATPPTADIWRRTEVFGPVLAVFPFSTEEEVVALANDTPLRSRRGRVDAATSAGPTGWPARSRRARCG